MKVHIGHRIEESLRCQGKSVQWLAQELGMQRPNVYRIFQSPSCDTALLLRLSYILHTDFFLLYSDCINKDTRIK